MLSNNFKLSLSGLFLGIILVGCNQKEEITSSESSTEKSVVLENISDSTWTYFSFVTGEIVGRSKLSDTTEDSLWYNRTDWDIALCSDMLRTNSGTSGRGEGGIQIITNRNFNAITTAPEEGYLIDNNEVILKR